LLTKALDGCEGLASRLASFT